MINTFLFISFAAFLNAEAVSSSFDVANCVPIAVATVVITVPQTPTLLNHVQESSFDKASDAVFSSTTGASITLFLVVTLLKCLRAAMNAIPDDAATRAF